MCQVCNDWVKRQPPKMQYLYAFEAAVWELIGLEGMRKFPPGLTDGLWCNAHMYYGTGLDAELAAVKFVTDVVERYHPHIKAA